MNKKKKKEPGFYICQVCGNKKKAEKDKKIECCGKDMLKPEKGMWDF